VGGGVLRRREETFPSYLGGFFRKGKNIIAKREGRGGMDPELGMSGVSLRNSWLSFRKRKILEFEKVSLLPHRGGRGGTPPGTHCPHGSKKGSRFKSLKKGRRFPFILQ